VLVALAGLFHAVRLRRRGDGAMAEAASFDTHVALGLHE
jgi:hypothetical protein